MTPTLGTARVTLTFERTPMRKFKPQLYLLTTLVAGFGISTVHGADFDSSRLKTKSVYTLSDPGPITNMVYRKREISRDGKTLIQTLIWLHNGDVRVVVEEGPNSTAARCVRDVPDALWGKMDQVREIRKTVQGTFERVKRFREISKQSQQKAERFRQMLEAKFGKENVIQMKRLPDQWYPTTADSLDSYVLSLNPEAFSNRPSDDPILNEGRMRLSMPDAEAMAHFMELEFDPKTFVKLRQRLFKGQNIIQEETWDTQAPIDASQFVMPPEVFTHMGLGEPTEYVGVGLSLRPSETGPFVVHSVISDGPAMRAGIKEGSRLTSIDGRPTQNMSLSEAAELIRGLPNKPVTIEIEEPETGRIQEFTLRRERILLTPSFHPPTKKEIERASKFLKELEKQLNKD